MKIALIRGAFLNPNELANYEPLVDKYKINSFSSQKPLGINKEIKNFKLFSPYDYGAKLSKFFFNRTLGDSHYLLNLKSHLKNYDILDTADPYYYYSFQAAKLKAKHPHIKLVSTVCETIAHNNETTLAKRNIKAYTTINTDLFVVHTELSRKCLIKEGVNPNKININRLGVDLRTFTPNPKTKNKILFVGRLVPEKGVWLLYNVFKKLIHKNPNLTLLLAGDGLLKNRLQKDIEINQLERKVTIKSFSYENIHKAYRQANIFVLPSYRTKTWEEQYGMALIEAMASGLSIVTTNCGAIPEVVGKTGIVCKQQNNQDLYLALSKLVNNSDLQNKLSKSARLRCQKHFNHLHFADRMSNVYDQLNNSNSCS